MTRLFVDHPLGGPAQAALDAYQNLVTPSTSRHGPAVPGATGLATFLPSRYSYLEGARFDYAITGFNTQTDWLSLPQSLFEQLALDEEAPFLGELSLTISPNQARTTVPVQATDIAESFLVAFLHVDGDLLFVGQYPVTSSMVNGADVFEFDYEYDAAFLGTRRYTCTQPYHTTSALILLPWKAAQM